MSTLAQWPADLPQPARSGYSYAPQSAFIETDMDSGAKQWRRRFTTTPRIVTVRWRMTQAQLARFESFFEGPLEAGAAWFSTPLLNGKGVTQVQAHFLDQSGKPYTVTTVDNGLRLDVAAQLLTLGLPVDAWNG